MKKLYTLLLALLPVFAIAQDFSFNWHTDSIQEADIGSDVAFYYDLVNNTSSDINLRWRLFTDEFAGLPNWEDYICEGVQLCFPSSVRTHDFTLKSDEDFIIYHHVNAQVDTGTGYSVICYFDTADSAGTVQCLTMELRAVMPDTLEINVNGSTAYVIDGDTFEIWDNNYVPLGTEDLVVESHLSQNAPNPFNGQTTISYSLGTSVGLLKIHDLTGKLVSEIPLMNNIGSVTLDGAFDAGIYFYSLWEDGMMKESKRMQVID